MAGFYRIGLFYFTRFHQFSMLRIAAVEMTPKASRRAGYRFAACEAEQ